MPREQYHASLNKKQKRRLNEISSTFFYGADKGSRTLLSGLGSRRSTDEPYPHVLYNSIPGFCFQVLSKDHQGSSNSLIVMFLL